MSKKKKILVILGGISKERAISIDTGISCIKALKKLNYRIIKFDPKFAPITDIKKKKSRYYLQCSSWKRWGRWNNSKFF